MLTFDETYHIYKYDGRPVPSVTQLLGKFVRCHIMGGDYYINSNTGHAIDAGSMLYAADFGSALHAGCVLALKGTLDWDGLDPQLVKPIRNFVEWAANIGFLKGRWITERPLYAYDYEYAGTPDIVHIDDDGLLTIYDIKTGGRDLVGAQLAAYQHLVESNKVYDAYSSIERKALILPRNGEPIKVESYTSEEDWEFFRCKLYQHYYINSR